MLQFVNFVPTEVEQPILITRGNAMVFWSCKDGYLLNAKCP